MRNHWILATFIVLTAFSAHSYSQTPSSKGKASWYGPNHHGKKTANGERFNQNALTAAHPTLPFGTKVKVTNTLNNKSIVVRINDRGPYAKGRIIDLSRGAAAKLDLIKQGVAPVHLYVQR